MDIAILKMIEDDEFSSRLLDCISVEEVQSCFDDEGVAISEDDAKKILSSIYGVNDELEEIDDFDLMRCVGGISNEGVKEVSKKNKLISSVCEVFKEDLTK